ncbi:zinc-ribbon domain-containing protein [Companilactobacillus baiquanensis]|uniref:Zinc-ribbon domain-containing protein n=1 Tax=Companilactobacillus baiquanensis TaxID=2486005 RepID=A0ABW1UXM3_9LACO|nr:zinc ribbon domain-containing protein [Companilactobacillus baiquanensis]
MSKYSYCIKCGKELAPGATFCQYCGAKQIQLENDDIEINKANEPENVTFPKKRTKTVESKKNISPTVRLIFGIIFIIVSVMALFQSFGVMAAYSIGGNSTGSASGAAGIIVSLIMLSLGIILIATRKNNSQGLKITIYILGIISALMGFGISSHFSDMSIYGILLIVGTILCNLPLASQYEDD